ncbi:MAG: hypothetical protein WAN11_05560 [Syntrophobacteraceae bacterium]
MPRTVGCVKRTTPGLRGAACDLVALAACRQRKRVRFTTAAAPANDPMEAKNKRELSRITNRWTRYELTVIDEMDRGGPNRVDETTWMQLGYIGQKSMHHCGLNFNHQHRQI